MFGQSQEKKDTSANTTKTTLTPSSASSTNATESKVLDTKESLNYMSDRLLFQVRKRLHLTTEEEEKKEEKVIKKQKNIVFSIGGIKIERN